MSEFYAPTSRRNILLLRAAAEKCGKPAQIVATLITLSVYWAQVAGLSITDVRSIVDLAWSEVDDGH